MTALAAVLSLPSGFALPDNSDDCLDCVDDAGLCHAERCRRHVLPQLAKPALVRLIGETRTEQTKRQTKIRRPLTQSPEAIAHSARVQSARSIARSKRRGYFGLAKAIASAKSL